MDAFEMRDGTFALLRDGKYPLSPTAASLLWFLLLCAFYDPRHRWYSHVNPAMATVDALCTATARSAASVYRALNELEELGFIQRFSPDSIKLTVPDDFCWAHRRRGHVRDAACADDCGKSLSK